SSQSVLSLDLGGLQAANASVNAGAGRHDECQQKLVGARRVVESDLHGVEVAAHVGRVDVGDGHVEASAGTTDFLGGGDDRLGATENFTHGIAAGDVPQGAVLDFSGTADDRALAVAFDCFRIAAENV